MVSIYGLKSQFQQMLRPLTRGLARSGVSANQVTVFAAGLSVAAGGGIFLWPDRRWPLLLIPFILFIRMALNAIDGMLAREHDMKSAFGGMLNEMGDVVSDSALYLPLCFVPGVSAIWVVLFVLLAVMGEMIGVVAVQIGAQRRYDGPMGKSDRAFVIGALCLALGLGMPAQPWLDIVWIGLVFLSCLTIVNRGRRALGSLK